MTRLLSPLNITLICTYYCAHRWCVVVVVLHVEDKCSITRGRGQRWGREYTGAGGLARRGASRLSCQCWVSFTRRSARQKLFTWHFGSDKQGHESWHTLVNRRTRSASFCKVLLRGFEPRTASNTLLSACFWNVLLSHSYSKMGSSCVCAAHTEILTDTHWVDGMLVGLVKETNNATLRWFHTMGKVREGKQANSEKTYNVQPCEQDRCTC